MIVHEIIDSQGWRIGLAFGCSSEPEAIREFQRAVPGRAADALRATQSVMHDRAAVEMREVKRALPDQVATDGRVINPDVTQPPRRDKDIPLSQPNEDGGNFPGGVA